MIRTQYIWQLRTQAFALGQRTVLMGILNVTPDSFSDGGNYLAHDKALNHALRLLDDGADLLDVGGESTRPGAEPVSAEDEQARILPVLRSVLKARPQAIVSVDTYHAETAMLAIEAGAEIINDVSGLLWDPRMADVLSAGRPGAVLMHTRGAPRQWSGLPALPRDQVLPLVVSGLARTLHLAEAAGMNRASILLDPGFGFGKRGDENFMLLAQLAQLHQFHLPLLAGVSRKRFLTGHLASPTPQERRDATLAANVAAILAGAHVLRVHDIPATRTASAVADALLSSPDPVAAISDRQHTP